MSASKRRINKDDNRMELGRGDSDCDLGAGFACEVDFMALPNSSEIPQA